MTHPVRLHVDSPEGRHVILVTPDQRCLSLSEMLRRHGLPLNTRCGQRGLCEGCVLELARGAVTHAKTGRAICANGHPIEIRACEHGCLGTDEDIHVRVPSRSMLGHQPQVLADFCVNVPTARDPIASDDNHPIGIAIDVGTTTLVVLVVRSGDGKILGKSSDFNRQADFGDDVLTRINLCLTDPTMLGQLQSAVVVDTIAPLIGRALDQAGVSAMDVGCITLAGNTTMLHLVAGVDPSSMGMAPFTPTFLDHCTMTASQIGLDLWVDQAVGHGCVSHDPPIHLLPGAAAYIGADLVAGVFASGLAYDDGPSLLVDIGTNGEVIACYNNHLIGCATAAGPAFEGSKLACGMRAADGAISHVRITGDSLSFEYEVIGDIKPIGMCGSAYIDLLAELRRVGLLNEIGRFNHDHVIAKTGRLVQAKYGHALRIAGEGGGVVITESDIVSLLQAKAAIAAGILTLLDRLAIGPSAIRTLNLAGGFGMHLTIDNAIGCGLLPGFQREQIKLVGNTSLAGAYVSLLDRHAFDALGQIGGRLESIELNLEPNFESQFIDQLALP